MSSNSTVTDDDIISTEEDSSATSTDDNSDNRVIVSNRSNTFNYDDILENHLGQLGKFQLRSFLWLCIPAMFHGSNILSYIFIGGVPLYRFLKKVLLYRAKYQNNYNLEIAMKNYFKFIL